MKSHSQVTLALCHEHTERRKKSRRKIERDNGKCKYFVLPLGIFLSSHDFNFRRKKRVAVESPIHHHQQWLETAQKTNRWYYTHQRGAIKVAAWRRDQVKRYASSIERQNPPFSNTRGSIWIVQIAHWLYSIDIHSVRDPKKSSPYLVWAKQLCNTMWCLTWRSFQTCGHVACFIQAISRICQLDSFARLTLPI